MHILMFPGSSEMVDYGYFLDLRDERYYQKCVPQATCFPVKADTLHRKVASNTKKNKKECDNNNNNKHVRG